MKKQCCKSMNDHAKFKCAIHESQHEQKSYINEGEGYLSLRYTRSI